MKDVFCVDCKYCNHDFPRGYTCGMTTSKVIDYVRGHSFREVICSESREKCRIVDEDFVMNGCGPEGNLFVLKEPIIDGSGCKDEL